MEPALSAAVADATEVVVNRQWDWGWAEAITARDTAAVRLNYGVKGHGCAALEYAARPGIAQSLRHTPDSWSGVDGGWY